MKFRLMAPVITFVILGTLTIPAQASFVPETDFSNDFKMFIDVANSNVSNFVGFVGVNNNSAPNIGVTTIGNVDTGSGWSNIKPVKDGFLTSLVFTPALSTMFEDFSFRAQFDPTGFGAKDTGVLDVIVTDQSDAAWTVHFTNLAGPNADFGRIGVISNAGETIKSVEILAIGGMSFKEVKQIGFSFAPGVTPPPSGEPIPEPSSLALLGLGLIASAFSLRRRSFLQA